MSIGSLPPKLIRYELLANEQLPTLAILEMQAEDGKHTVLVNRRMLEQMASVFRNVSKKLAKPS